MKTGLKALMLGKSVPELQVMANKINKRMGNIRHTEYLRVRTELKAILQKGDLIHEAPTGFDSETNKVRVKDIWKGRLGVEGVWTGNAHVSFNRIQRVYRGGRLIYKRKFKRLSENDYEAL